MEGTQFRFRFAGCVFTLLTLVVGIWGPAVQAKTNDQSQKVLMAALGDSITAGFLSFTFLDWFNPQATPLDPNSVEKKLAQANPATPNLSLLNLPITLLESRTHYSWATGEDIQSQYILLKNYLHEKNPSLQLSATNLAKTGGTTSDVIDQAGQLVTLMNSGQYGAVKYITLLIGNNDACVGTSDAVMLQNLHLIFQKLSQIKQGEPVRILMSGIPRIPDLGNPTIKNSKTLGGETCDQLRKELTHECLPLTTWTSTEQYQSLINLIVDKNTALALAAAEAQADFPNLQITFSDEIYQQSLTVSDLAVDCFHPNADAHQRISNILWGVQPWFR